MHAVGTVGGVLPGVGAGRADEGHNHPLGLMNNLLLISLGTDALLTQVLTSFGTHLLLLFSRINNRDSDIIFQASSYY